MIKYINILEIGGLKVKFNQIGRMNPEEEAYAILLLHCKI